MGRKLLHPIQRKLRLLCQNWFSKSANQPERERIYLPEKRMKLGFGAIGKGYAADKVKQLLQTKGLKEVLLMLRAIYLLGEHNPMVPVGK